MTPNHEKSLIETARAFLTGKRLTLVAAGTVAALALLALGSLSSFKGSDGNLLTYTVNRGSFAIDIVESGSVEASESEVIRSQVEGRTTILSLVPEGTLITEEDVERGMVLVELDSSDLRDKELKQEIAVQGESAKLADAKATYEIRVKQNESDLKKGELNVKFARMDLQKYLGSESADLFIGREIELSYMLNGAGLGGEALQNKRRLESDIDLGKEEVARAGVRLDWTKRLFDKGYVTRDDLQADKLVLKREQVSQEQAETALNLFLLYEFEKEAEKRRSDSEEAVRELDRILAKNEAEMSKAEARLKSAEASYANQVSQLKKIREQLENCTIRATHPGLVVYAGMSHRFQSDKMEEGKQVREQEEIIQIPNTTSMMVRTTVHESVIASVQEKQKAKITIDSLPDRILDGEVIKVAILPDQENRWLNPNLKVYKTDVSILGTDSDLKPGMSAQVRIIIKELDDVLMIPLQAVTTHNGKRVCFVKTALGAERRKIKTGDYNDKFIEVKNGLEEGEEVILNADDFSSQG